MPSLELTTVAVWKMRGNGKSNLMCVLHSSMLLKKAAADDALGRENGMGRLVYSACLTRSAIPPA